MTINELIEQIGGRERLEAFSSGHYCSVFECRNMASALLSVLDSQENITIRKRKVLLWLERQQAAHPGMNEVRYAIELITTPAGDGWKMVPLEPTQRMIDAHIEGMVSGGATRAYRDMLAAAPAPGGDAE